MKTLKLKGYQDYTLSCYIWDKVEKPIGVVQIFHGMQEHARRYADLAKYLNNKGFIVFAADQRGHGNTCLLNNSPFGYSNGDIFMETVQDQIVFTNYLIEKYKLPISIFAHSYGSFIAQKYMIENGFKIKNIILCGSTYTKNLQFRAGCLVAKTLKLFGLKKKKASLIEKLSLKTYGKKFPEGNWLTRDNKIWHNYATDELCGKSFPVNFYHSMFKNSLKNYKDIKNIPYYLPILIISGTDDPVPGENGVFKLFVTYGKAYKKVYLKTYLDARHELINETCKEEVYRDISTFFLTDKLDYIAITVG